MKYIIYNGKETPISIASTLRDYSLVKVDGLVKLIPVENSLILDTETIEIKQEERDVPTKQSDSGLVTDAKGINLVPDREPKDGQKHSSKQVVRKGKRRGSGN